MIRCYFRKKEEGTVENFDDLAALITRLSASLEARDETIVLRVPDDETFFDVSLYRETLQQRAEQSVHMIAGTSAPFWGQGICAPDGEGWRLLWSPVLVNSQRQQVPAQPNSKRR